MPLGEALLDEIGQVETLLLHDLSVDDFVGHLAETDHLSDPDVLKMVQEQSLSPEILEKVVLLKNGIIYEEEVEEVIFSLFENGLSFGSITVI